MFRRPARRAFGSVALVCAAAGKLCIAFSGRKFFTGGRVGLAVFQPGMSAVAFIEGHKGGFAVFYVVLKKVFAGFAGFIWAPPISGKMENRCKRGDGSPRGATPTGMLSIKRL